jgi:hypothetical protein
MAVLLLLATAAASVLLLRNKAEDPDTKMLRQTVAELRGQLLVQQADGYVLSGERVAPWIRRGFVVIRRGYMEAAARLAMWADFDLRLFDAFCVCLIGDEYVEAEADEALILGCSPQQPQRSLQHVLLREWLLTLCMQLLDPRVQELSFRSDVRIERYALVTLQPTTSVGHGQAGGSGREPSAVFSRTSSDISRTISSRGARRQSTSTEQTTISRAYGATFGRTVSAAVVRKMDRADVHDLDEHDALGLSSSAAMRFFYFESKVLKLQIWREDGGELFLQLKERLQEFMDKLAKVWRQMTLLIHETEPMLTDACSIECHNSSQRDAGIHELCDELIGLKKLNSFDV